MRAIIVEDELNVREGFVKLIQKFCPEISVVNMASSVEEAMDVIAHTSFEILFLDINLPDGSGFDLVHRLDRRDFHIIFVTAYNQYAIDAFRVSAVDYLMKPVSPDGLKKAIAKVRGIGLPEMSSVKTSILADRLAGSYQQSEKIILKDQDAVRVVEISTIIYCQADGGYTKFFIEDAPDMLVTTNLKDYERILSPYGFVRNHHSFMVNLNRVTSIEKADGGYVVLDDTVRLPVSKRKRTEVMEALKLRYLN